MTSNIKICDRETEQYALNQPTMLRVSIADGKVLEDNRHKFVGANYCLYNLEQPKGRA